MGAFNLAEAIGLKKVSNLDTGELQEIGLDLIDPNPNNFFEVEEDITDLKESIELNGLLQPPVVTPSEDGRYRLIAGHRRHKALKSLWTENPEKYKTVMCRIVRPASPELEELMLIQTNTEARELGWSEKDEAAKRVERILVDMQKSGVELPGKMRTHVAKIIKASESQIARAKFISKNLIAPLKKKGFCISDAAAYKLAHLPAEQQSELYEHYKKNPWMIDGTRIITYLDNIAAGMDPFYVQPPGPRDCYVRKTRGGKFTKCDYADVIEKRKQSKLPEYQRCGNRDCCSYCSYRFDCEDVCPVVKKTVEKHKTTDTFKVCNSLREAREKKGLSIDEVAKTLNLSISQIQQYETNQNHTAASLATLCKMYYVTPNEILGFDAVTAPTRTAEWIPADQTGDLPDGLYFMLYEYSKPYQCADGNTLVQERAVRRKNGQWLLLPSGKTWNRLAADERLIAVIPVPDEPAGHSLAFIHDL